MVALVTPMQENGQIDEGALRRLVDWHLQNNTDALVAVGTTGESATLNETEHCQVIKIVVEQVAGRVPVIAGTGSNATHEAIALSQCAKKAGADALLLVTPYYNKPPQEGLYQHFKTIAQAVDLPQILYNVPGRTACDLQVETVARLAQIDNIIGIKDATADLSRVRQHRKLCGKNFGLYSGDDATSCDFIQLGGDGMISVTANVAPQKMHDMCMAALQGDYARAQAIDDELARLHRDLFLQANPIPVKWAVHQLGLIGATLRLPLVTLAENHHEQLKQAMQNAGVG
jgi:4-hydroxy-tetrahydrodipicolinate synthase